MEGKEQVHLQSCFLLGLQVLTRDALAAGLAACRTHANMFPPASALRSMPSSLPNGSASVEPTPRWPVVGTLMGGFTLTHTHSHSLTHLPHLPHLPPLPHHLPHLPHLPHSLTHPLTHFTSLHSLHSLSHPSLTHTTLTSLTHTLTHSLYMNIHTYTQTHPPSPLHHSYTSSSLLAFLWSV